MMATSPISARTLISIQQAANHVGVHTKTIRRWIADGKLTSYRPSARVIRLDLAELEELINSTASTRWNEVA